MSLNYKILPVLLTLALSTKPINSQNPRVPAVFSDPDLREIVESCTDDFSEISIDQYFELTQRLAQRSASLRTLIPDNSFFGDFSTQTYRLIDEGIVSMVMVIRNKLDISRPGSSPTYSLRCLRPGDPEFESGY